MLPYRDKLRSNFCGLSIGKLCVLNMHIRTMLRILRFRIDWTPIACATLASMKVRYARDSMVLMDSDRFMKQVMNVHCTVFGMGQADRTCIPPRRCIFLYSLLLSGHTALLITARSLAESRRFSKLIKISHRAEQLISAIGVEGPKETEAQTI
jgi:hypothetical protein